MKTDPLERLREAFIAGGREAIDADPELRALLDASPEFQKTMAALDEIDQALPALEPTRMPPQLLDRILAADAPLPWWKAIFRFTHARDYALGVAAALLLVMPWAAMWLLSQQSRVEFQVLELQPSIVRLDMAAIEERSLPKLADATVVHTVADAPQVAVALEPRQTKYKERLASSFASKQWPSVNVAALVNSFQYAAATQDVELKVEIGPTPWSSETRLVRVYVSTPAGATAKDAALQISFNDERVMSYQRIAEPGAGGATTSTIDGQFTALFEVVPLQRIGATLREDSVYASLRFVDEKGERRMLHAEGVDRGVGFDAMPIDYRFAASAAWFALETKGGPKISGLATRLQRLMAVASRALGSEEKKDRVALVSMARAASDQAHK